MKAIFAAALLAFVFWLIATVIPADAAKGGKPKTCDWDVYYACIDAGGDRLYCLSQCMR